MSSLVEREGKEAAGIGILKYNFAHVHEEQGDFDEALRLLEESLEHFRIQNGETNFSVYLAERAMGRIKEKQGDLAAAEAHLWRVVEGWPRAVQGDNSHKQALLILGRIHLASAESNEAEQILRQALAIELGEESPDPEFVARSQWMIGRALMAQSRYPEAEAELRASHRAMLDTVGPDHQGTKRIAESLEELSRLRASAE